jgi:hypothetical protein
MPVIRSLLEQTGEMGSPPSAPPRCRVVPTLHFAQIMTAWLGAQLIEQRLGLLQVGGVEALGEPVVDVS